MWVRVTERQRCETERVLLRDFVQHPSCSQQHLQALACPCTYIPCHALSNTWPSLLFAMFVRTTTCRPGASLCGVHD